MAFFDVSKEAEADLDNHAAYLGGQSFELAQRFLAEAKGTFQRFADFPASAAYARLQTRRSRPDCEWE